MGEGSGCDASRAALAGFRDALYGCLAGWGDALFELCDATLCAGAPIGSVPALSPRARVPAQPRQPVQGARPGVDRRRAAARRPRRASTGGLAGGVRGRRLDLAALRCRDEPRARLLLPPVAPLGGPADRGRLVVPVGRRAVVGAATPGRRRSTSCASRPAEDATSATIGQLERLVGAPRRRRAGAALRARRRLRPDRARRRARRHAGRRSSCASAPTGCSTPTPSRGPTGAWGGPAGTGPASAAPTRPAGPRPTRPSPPTTRATAGCRSRPGMASTRSSRAAVAGPAPCRRSSAAASSGSRSSTCPRPTGPGAQDALAVVVGARHARPRRLLAGLPAALRPRAHVPLRQARAGLDDAGAAARPSRPTAGPGSSSPPTPSCASPAASSPTSACPGNARASRPGSARPASAGVSADCSRIARHARQSTEIPDSRSGTSQGNPPAPADPLPGHQEGCLTGLIASSEAVNETRIGVA